MPKGVKKSLSEMYRRAISDEGLPETLTLTLGDKSFSFHKVSMEVGGEKLGLRYGTNPHQKAAIYKLDNSEKICFGGMILSKSGKEGLSGTNVEDGYRSLRVVNHFSEAAVAVMKHFNPTGVGIARGDEELVDVFEKAWNGDPRAAYGSVVGLNVPVDEGVADKVTELINGRRKRFVECLFAPSYAPETLDILKKTESLRVVEVPKADKILDEGLSFEIKVFRDAILLEQPFYTKLNSLEDLENLDKDERTGIVTKRCPTEQEKQDLVYAWWVCNEKRSNGVVIWKGDRVLAVGTGQQDRIGAVEITLERADRVGHDLEGSVLASDGFMLDDNVDPLGKVGVSAIIQPGGSKKDKEVIKKCDEYDIAMIFTGERSFRHF